MSFEFTLIDNSGNVLKELGLDIPKGLEAVGMQAENYSALELENNPPRVDSGRLRGSITHKVDAGDQSVTVGTNVKYAIYVHEGTGIYAAGGGTGGYWVYVIGGDGSMAGKAKGKRYSLAEAKRIVAMMREEGLEAYYTNGMKPNRFLKNAIEKHKDEYIEILKKYLQS